MYPSAVEEILKEWKRKSGSTKPLMYRIKDNVLSIYTSQPGWLIGKGAYLVDEYSAKIKERFKKDITVSIYEVEYTII